MARLVQAMQKIPASELETQPLALVPAEFPSDAQLLNRYEVFGEVARGGIGVVYRGRHKSLDRPVAIKITLPGAPIERFLREAKLLASLSSPFIVHVNDFEVLPAPSCAA